MNCPFDKEKLSGYYDGELGAAERSEVERHIASCSECLRDLGELKSAALLVKDLPRLRAPKSIAEGVSREIQAAGKLHSMAKVRRVVLWATAAAAGLFVVMNVMVLSRQAPAPGANEPTVALAPAKAAPMSVEERTAADRAGEPELSRRIEARKNLGEGAEKRAPAEVLEEARRLDQAREKSAAPATPAPKPSEALAKAEQAPPPPSAAAPAPVPPAAPGRPMPAPTAPPADALRAESGLAAEKEKLAAAKEKPAAAREADAAKKSEADPKSNAAASAAAAGAPPELPPAQFNVVARELAKARPRLEDSLKKMGLTLPPPPAQPTRQPRNREENTIVLELTDAQLARLQADLEKPGDARLVQTPTVEPVLPGFRGGLFGKKDGPTGGTKAGAAGKDKELKDGKEADDAAALAAGPRRKVTLHLVESKTLPAAEGEPAPPQK
jgi:hypothetical protein